MSGLDVALLATAVLLLGLTALTAVAETALTRVSRTKAAALADEGVAGAPRLVRLVGSPERVLGPILLVAVTSQLLEAALVAVVAVRHLAPVGLVVAMLVNVAVVYVVAEAAPKTWAMQHPERAALASAAPVTWLVGFPPVRALTRLLAGAANVLVPGKGLRDAPFTSEGELLALAEAAVEEQVLEESERDLIEQILEFGDTVVRAVMVPRPDIVAVPAEFRVADVMEVAILNGYSRLPAFGDDLDDIVGIVHAKDLMRAERDGDAGLEVRALLRPARFVPESKHIASLLREMQDDQFHLAVVVDEYGATAGVVTLEDLIEELVGEIVDEFDREEASVEPVPDGGVRVAARLGVDELEDLLGVELPAGDWETVAGLYLHLAGQVPGEGDTVRCGELVLRAERVQGRRIGKVRITHAAGLPLRPGATRAPVDLHEGEG